MNSLGRNVRYSVFGYTVFLTGQTGVILVISRFQSIEDAGRYGFSLAVLSILFVLSNLGLRTSYATDLASTKSYSIYMQTRRFTSLIALTIGLGITATLYLYDARTSAVFVILLISKSSESFSDMAYGCFQRHHRMDLVLKSLIIRGFASFFLFATATYLTGSLIFSLILQSTTWTITAFLHDYRTSISLPDNNSNEKQPSILEIIVENIPLGIGNLFTEITVSSPRVIVTSLQGLSQGGIYSAIGYSLIFGSAFAASVTHATASKLAEAHNAANKGAFLRLLLVFTVSLFFVGILIVLVVSIDPDFIVVLTFGDQYAGNGNLLVMFCLVLAARMPVAALQTGLIAQRQMVVNAKIRLLTCVATICTSLYTAKNYSIEEVVLCLLIVSICQLILLTNSIRQSIPTPQINPK